jgi:hypothetical protein
MMMAIRTSQKARQMAAADQYELWVQVWAPPPDWEKNHRHCLKRT